MSNQKRMSILSVQIDGKYYGSAQFSDKNVHILLTCQLCRKRIAEEALEENTRLFCYECVKYAVIIKPIQNETLFNLMNHQRIICRCSSATMPFHQFRAHLRNCPKTILPCCFAKYGCTIMSTSIADHESPSVIAEHFKLVDEHVAKSLTEKCALISRQEEEIENLRKTLAERDTLGKKQEMEEANSSDESFVNIE